MKIDRFDAARMLLAAMFTALAAPASAPVWAAGAGSAAAVVADATAGRMKATRGKYFEPACNESLDYEAEVVDLNGDGRPEVFTSVMGICLGGGAGVHMNLYVQGADGRWRPQFGFPGIYEVLKTRNKGYPDIAIGGPGNCAPVWRWNGGKYALYKKCR